MQPVGLDDVQVVGSTYVVVASDPKKLAIGLAGVYRRVG